ncbi:MAG: hypothetical protein ABI778_02045 [Ignavibacteriota bacterium]
MYRSIYTKILQQTEYNDDTTFKPHDYNLPILPPITDGITTASHLFQADQFKKSDN